MKNYCCPYIVKRVFLTSGSLYLGVLGIKMLENPLHRLYIAINCIIGVFSTGF